ncbi:formylmethanofuran--tetrahydromethanopterin N-formyltransferase [soil metagenome]
MSAFEIDGVRIEDTFAEAFPMTACRVIVTAESSQLAEAAAQSATGHASSVIGCDTEAACDQVLAPSDTPDGRPGVSLLFFGFSRDALQAAVVNRVGQNILPCPTTSCFDGLPQAHEKTIRVGGNLRFFGDGFQSSKLLERRRFWRIPVMDGEFLCEDVFGTVKGVGGGNFILMGEDQAATLAAAQTAARVVQSVPGVIAPFPSGIVRSGSKVGSHYKKLKASTNDAYCPTLRAVTKSDLPNSVNAVYEIVMDGLDKAAIERATRDGVRAACGRGIVAITAGNYGGKLGPFHFHLHQLLRD